MICDKAPIDSKLNFKRIKKLQNKIFLLKYCGKRNFISCSLGIQIEIKEIKKNLFFIRIKKVKLVFGKE